MHHLALHFVVRVCQGYCDFDRPLWERDEENILKGFLNTSGFFSCLPLLENGAEGMAIDDLTRLRILHAELSST